jgi:hypothetical protein
VPYTNYFHQMLQVSIRSSAVLWALSLCETRYVWGESAGQSGPAAPLLGRTLEREDQRRYAWNVCSNRHISVLWLARVAHPVLSQLRLPAVPELTQVPFCTTRPANACAPRSASATANSDSSNFSDQSVPGCPRIFTYFYPRISSCFYAFFGPFSFE